MINNLSLLGTFPLCELPINLTGISGQYNTPSKNKKTKKYSKYELYHLDIFEDLELDDEYKMPIIRPFEGALPMRLVPFHEAIAKRDYDCTVHFYINDALFVRVLRQPKRYLSILKRFKSVITPDFSQFVNMNEAQRRYNAYCNRALGAYWQNNGVNIIYNVTWSVPDSYGYSFSGVPKNSVVAVNCMGIRGCNASKYLWLKGYNEMLKRMSPKSIVRYGDVMPDEKEEISTFFENNQWRRLRHGR